MKLWVVKHKIICFLSILMIVSILCFGILWLANRNLSSHHASINIDMSIYDSTKERLIKFDNMIRMMKEWAIESDMNLIEGNETINLSSFTSESETDTREYSFKDELSPDEVMPLQVMVSYDINSSLQTVRIMFAEGYSREPSSRLQKISNDLYSRLDGYEATYNIW